MTITPPPEWDTATRVRAWLAGDRHRLRPDGIPDDDLAGWLVVQHANTLASCAQILRYATADPEGPERTRLWSVVRDLRDIAADLDQRLAGPYVEPVEADKSVDTGPVR